MLTFPVRPANGKKTGVTIGNFDGVHRGHQLLVHKTLEICAERGLDSVAVTFWPHPRALFSGRQMPPLADLQNRRKLLGGLGVSFLLELNFTREIAALTPDEFVRTYLLPLDMDSLVIGYDFCLGKGRSGDFAALAELGGKYGFSVTQVPPLMLGEAPISSTRLRRAIEQGELGLARDMLGHPYAFDGRVVHGQGRGTGLGFPTANLLPPEVLLPPDGVYATRLTHRGVRHAAVSNIGFSPTFGGTQRTIESFILEGDINLYGEVIELEFLERLRDERRFPGVQELTAQIARDVEQARNINLAAAGA
ncbi:MAG: bifunctional riboflavin kinase/FAD synthetase [Desulfovibrionaceae bacterium]|nr:bifunctional riboflavin kinase/FAD synthetase [Desulfovibrionaceae bacterium]